MEKIKIHFYPDIEKNFPESGAVSEISWQRLLPHLESAFAKRSTERLIGITVTELGVKAFFQSKPTK